MSQTITVKLVYDQSVQQLPLFVELYHYSVRQSLELDRFLDRFLEGWLVNRGSYLSICCSVKLDLKMFYMKV